MSLAEGRGEISTGNPSKIGFHTGEARQQITLSFVIVSFSPNEGWGEAPTKKRYPHNFSPLNPNILNYLSRNFPLFCGYVYFLLNVCLPTFVVKYKPMMTENQQKAHDLFFQTDLNQQQIADLVGVNRKTLYGWMKQGKWLRAKHAASFSPMLLVEQYCGQLVALNNKIAAREEPVPTKDEADIIRKISTTIQKVRDENQTVCEIIELFTNFTNVMKKKDLDLTKKVIVHMDEYIKDRLSDAPENADYKIRKQEHAFEEEYQQWLQSNLPTENCQSPTVNCELPAENGVQNGVCSEQPDSHKALTENDLHEKSSEKLSTNKKSKQGVAPAPQNRRERREHERILRKKTKHTKGK